LKKLNLYLDTSVISYLDQKDAPEQTAQTQKFWDKVKNDEYNIFISSVVDDEISKCDEDKEKDIKYVSFRYRIQENRNRRQSDNNRREVC